MRIRPAGDGDLDLVVDLRLDFLADHRGTTRSAFEPDFVADTRAFVVTHHAGADLVTWLAEDGDTAIGVVSVLRRSVPPRPEQRATTEGYVVNLYVRPAWRRRGVGQALVDAVLDHARAAGYRRLVLHATDDGRPMYERAGFRAEPRWLALDL